MTSQYSPVFSSPFVQYTSASPNSSFIVPDGFTAVVRQISGNQDVGDYIVWVSIQDSIAAPQLTIWQETAVGAFVNWAAEGRWVVPQGGVIVVHTTALGTSPSFYVGGYLLRNVPG